jgi:hypothetical protein
MKNILLIAVILLAGLSLLAQETTIDKAEFDKAMSANYQTLRNQPNRTIEETEEQGLGGTMKRRVIREQVGTASRIVFESDSASSYMKTEYISINGKRFKRTLNNPWIVETSDIKSRPNILEKTSEETVYKSLGDAIIDDKKVKVYRTLNAVNYLNKERGGDFQVKTDTTYYFDEAGVMIKSEVVSESINKPKNDAGAPFIQKETKSARKTITSVKIDPNIKIEEPQIG